MTLNKKMASILLLIMVIATIMYFGVFKLVVLKSFVDAENSDAIQDMHQCISVFNLEINHLSKFVHDWSSWDDSYEFVADRSQEFVKENLGFVEYRSQSLSLIHFYDRDGRLVWGKTYDLNTEKEIPLNLARDLNPSLFLKLVTQKDPEKSTSGIIQTSIGPMLIAARPILGSDNKGLSHGALVMGRLFTQESLTALSEMVGVKLKAWPVGDEHIPKDIRELIPFFSDQDSVKLISASPDILHAYAIVNDISNKPVIIMEASFPRNITHKGTRAYVIGMMFILGAGLLIFLSILVMLRTYILKPIAKLTENALAIGVSTKDVTGFEINRKDEIGVLSQEFAAMVHRLSMSEERYRSILENMEEAYYEVDLEGRFTFINASLARTYGYTEDELMGMSYKEYMDEENIEKVFKTFNRIYVTGDTEKGIDWKVRHKNGTESYLESSVSLRRDFQGNPIGFKGVTRDITQKKKADEALRESEAKYRFLMENMTDMIWTTDLNLSVTYVSPSIEKSLGYSPEERVGRKTSEIMTPESFAHAMEIFISELKRENVEGVDPNRIVWFESEYYHKNGSIICFENAANPIRDKTGRMIGVYGVSRDITQRKKVEEEKKGLEDRLFQAQKMESIGTLAGGIAHDFNNLLTGILGNVSLALMNMEDSNPLRERLKNVEEYVQRGSDLTKQLLGFARGGKYEVKPTNLSEFIRKSSEMFGRTKKEIHIHYKAQEGLWAVDVDRGQMEQVLLNLYVNAWQAMTGGGDLYLSVENVMLGMMEVGPYDIRPGKFVKITVTDTGIGMNEETKARIFEPFFTTKEQGRGTGLGLASVYGIVKNHGGFIHVESEKDIGTSFMIYLPASENKIEDMDRPEDEVQMGGEGTILLIDDEEMILDIGAKMLEGLGYIVMTATGGRKGLQIYEKDKDKIRLVILDMIMPDFSGKETFNALLRINPSVRVLLSSGYSIDDQAREIMQSGCHGFIQKPFTMVELSKKIRKSLDV